MGDHIVGFRSIDVNQSRNLTDARILLSTLCFDVARSQRFRLAESRHLGISLALLKYLLILPAQTERPRAVPRIDYAVRTVGAVQRVEVSKRDLGRPEGSQEVPKTFGVRVPTPGGGCSDYSGDGAAGGEEKEEERLV